MRRAKLLYAAILIGMAAFYVLYIDSLALLMLLCVLIVPVFLRLGLVWMHFHSECRLTCGALSCQEGDSVPVTVTLESRCPLFFPRAEAEICVRHAFGRHPEILRLKFPVQAKNFTRLTFYLHADYCGIIDIRLQKLRVYDMFRLFRTQIISDHDHSRLLVLPKPVFLPLSESAPPVSQPESTRFADRPGDDPSEIFGIREYMPGDPVSRIHWKLSSRSGTMLLKEFSLPIEKNTLLLAEYVPGRSLSDAQGLLTLLYSLVYAMTSALMTCELAWFDGEKIVICQPDSEESLSEAFRNMYDAFYQMEADPEAVRDAFSGHVYSSATVITNCAGTELLPLLEQDITANQKNFLVVTASETDLRSDLAAIHIIHPDHISIETLIV